MQELQLGPGAPELAATFRRFYTHLYYSNYSNLVNSFCMKFLKVDQTSISNSQQQNLQYPCCSKCLQALNDPSFPFQYCEFPCNPMFWGTFPLVGSLFLRKTLKYIKFLKSSLQNYEELKCNGLLFCGFMQ